MIDGKSVYIIDDDAAVRDSLSVLLEAQGYCVKHFSDGQDFLDQADNLALGCVLLDIRMPGLDGLTLQRVMIDRGLSLPVIVITGFADVSLAVEAMRLGATNFLEKPVSPDILIQCIEEALALAVAQSDEVERVRISTMFVDSLTPRERDVLLQMVQGLANKEVGLALDLSPRTVEVHRKRIFEKFGVKSLAGVVQIAMAAGVVLPIDK